MKSIDKLAGLFRRFPGVGPKQAERFALHVVRAQASEVEDLVEALRAIKADVRECSRCRNYSDSEVCPVCSDHNRDQGLVCVVEQPQDVAAIEKTKSFNGVYHVLHGSISPMEGIGAANIRLKELAERVRAADGAVREIIIATNPDTEGETTAHFLTRALKGSVPRITRIAYGVPLGGDIDYMDEVTLGYALKGRVSL